MDLSDGPTPSGSVVAGASTDTLTIVGARPGDSGFYDCVVGNACGGDTSTAAQLVVSGADWDHNTLVNSADISAFLASWLQSVQSGTLEGDVNNDRQVNSADISAFLTAWLAAVQTGW